MASRKEEKALARRRRVAEEQALAARAQRRRRLRVFAGVVTTAIIAVAVMVVIAATGDGTGTIGPHSRDALAAVKHVDALLAGIPESGSRLGSARAPVTITEYGDLECSVCDQLAAPPSFTDPEGGAGTGIEDALIAHYVRTGKVKLVFRPLETASSGNPDPSAFMRQQAAADAAGAQRKAWYYIELFYNEQGPEGARYVTMPFLNGIARQVHGLNFARWTTDRNWKRIKREVMADDASGVAVTRTLPRGVSTPTLIIKGRNGRATALQGVDSSTWSDLQSAIRSASQ
jgi:hypothetical protein